MAKKLLLRSSVYPYHVTARSNNREWFYLPTADLWELLSDQLYGISVAYGAHIHAFVLMSNHFHLLVSTPDANLDAAMNYFMRETSRAINRYSGRTNHVFGRRYHWSLIQNPLYYAHALKYAYSNPIRAGICSSVEEYLFSSVRGLCGKRNLRFPIFSPMAGLGECVPKEITSLLQWLNRPIHEVAGIDLIRKALRRRCFEFPAKSLLREVTSLDKAML